MKQVKIYTSSGCRYCLMAKQLFSKLNIPYEEKSLAADPAEAEALSEKYNRKTVPMIFIDGVFVGGYDDVVALHERGELMKKMSE